MMIQSKCDVMCVCVSCCGHKQPVGDVNLTMTNLTWTNWLANIGWLGETGDIAVMFSNVHQGIEHDGTMTMTMTPLPASQGGSPGKNRAGVHWKMDGYLIQIKICQVYLTQTPIADATGSVEASNISIPRSGPLRLEGNPSVVFATTCMF